MESVDTLYNITITDVNITQVNISLPSNFSFNLSSNGTNASDVVLVNFTNITGDVLIWTNDTSQFYLLNGSNTTTFWFNATASYPGTYNFSVSVMNATDTYLNNSISITVNDTSNPTASLGTNPIEMKNASVTGVTFNLKCSDGYAANDLEFWGNWSGSWAINQTNASMNNNSFWNVSLNLSDGTYLWGAYCNDSTNNSDWSANRTLIVDTVAPVAAATCTSSLIGRGDSITCSCSGTDNTSGINSSATSAGSTPDTSFIGVFTYSCGVSDYSGNSANNDFTYTVSGGGGVSGGSSSSSNFWTAGTFTISDEIFEESYTKELSKKQRFKVSVNSESHYIGVVDLTTSTATINITSDPQQIVLTVGDERKVEVSGDDYYDVLVKLNSIGSNKASITIQAINELVTPESTEQEQQKEDASGDLKETELGGEPEKKGLDWWGWVIIAVVIVGLILIFSLRKKK